MPTLEKKIDLIGRRNADADTLGPQTVKARPRLGPDSLAHETVVEIVAVDMRGEEKNRHFSVSRRDGEAGCRLDGSQDGRFHGFHGLSGAEKNGIVFEDGGKKAHGDGIERKEGHRLFPEATGLVIADDGIAGPDSRQPPALGKGTEDDEGGMAQIEGRLLGRQIIAVGLIDDEKASCRLSGFRQSLNFGQRRNLSRRVVGLSR